MAKVMSGCHDTKRDWEILHFCLNSVENKSAIYPISLSIFTESLKISNRQRRKCLRKIIERLSRYMVVTNQFVVATHEIEALLDHKVGPNPTPINSVDYLDWGIFRAMGITGNFKIMSDGGDDITATTRQSFSDGPATFDRILLNAQLELNRQILDGPSRVDESEFRQQGYNPESILDLYEREASDEAKWARLLDKFPSWRRGRLRDLVSVREIVSEFYSILERGCEKRGVESSFKSLFPTVDDARNAFDSMPSFDASVTLKTSIHRNGRHHWRNNHIHDIHALSVTLPYCDIVVTDREMASLASQSKLTERLKTTVLRSILDLPEHI